MSVIDWPSAVVALQERLARAEKVIEAARVVLAQYEPHEIVDGEAELQRALAEYDRPSAPLDAQEGET